MSNVSSRGTWLADLCAQEQIPFVLGHALYMKAIHGGKAKHDTIDAQKIAVLLRGGMLPQAYVYPAEMRATRDLLRRRLHLTRKRAELLAHVQQTNSQYNLEPFGKKLSYKANRVGVAERFPDVCVAKSVAIDLELLEHYDRLIKELELYLVRHAKLDDAYSFHLLRSVPGIGKVLSETRREAVASGVRALVFVGDAMEENVDELCAKAGELGLLKVPAFMFQEGHDPEAERAFREIARLTGGAWCRFDPGAKVPEAVWSEPATARPDG